MVFFFFLYRIRHIHNLALVAVVLLAHKNQLQLEETQVDSPLNQYHFIVNPNKEKMVRLMWKHFTHLVVNNEEKA